MTGQAYRGPNRGPQGCVRDTLVCLTVMAVLAIVVVNVGAHLGWWS